MLKWWTGGRFAVDRRRRAGRSELLRRREYVVDVALDADLSPGTGDAAVRADEEGRALDPHVFPSVHRLLDPAPIGLDGGLLGVGGEDHSEVVLGLELVVR